MNWRTLATATMVSIAATGCGSDDAADTPAAGTEQAAAPPADSAAAPAQPAPPPEEPRRPVQTGPTPRQAPEPPRQAPVVTPVLDDEPWTPTDTGSVSPGMSRDDVIGTWGPPEVERSIGSMTYLYFRNGCEVSCGTYDVVFLDAGQVVDAIVRGIGHTYTGVSSSPPGRTGQPTLPDTVSGTIP